MRTQGYRSGGARRHGYVGNYEMTPSDRQFRAPLVTRKPEIAGFQSALVIKDKRPGDRRRRARANPRAVLLGPEEEAVAAGPGGADLGGKQPRRLFVPRVGDEVLVAYEEGDPDRPIVIGSVYNGTNTVPMTLPDKKTQSGILTRSSTGGSGYNMLLFDDTAGSEKVKMRSQKDLMFKALNNEQRDILNSQTENIGQDETINVGFPARDPGSGNFTLNALNKVTINVGPKDADDPNQDGHFEHHAERRPGRRDEPDRHEPNEHHDAVDRDHGDRQRDREHHGADGPNQ